MKKRWLLWVAPPVALIAILLIYGKARYELYTNPSGAMLDTIKTGQVVMVDKLAYSNSTPAFQEIIVFRPPKAACFPYQLDENGVPNVVFVKRCMGLPGDVVEIRDGVLIRNGNPVKEAYVRAKPTSDFKLVSYKGTLWPLLNDSGMVNQSRQETADRFILEDYTVGEKMWKLPSAKIPAGFILTMGDNRNESFDSRAWGLEPIKDVIGKVIR